MRAIGQYLNSENINKEKIIVGDYEMTRYCPHQRFDLKFYGEIDLEENSLTCLGHGWKWNIENGMGINTQCSIHSKRIVSGNKENSIVRS